MSKKGALSFLAELARDPAEKLRQVWWLLTEFEAPVWSVSIGYKTARTVDWRVELEDGSLLTEPKNSELLKGFKYFLAASTESSNTRSRRVRAAISTQQMDFTGALRVIDKLLVNSHTYELGKHGLEGVTENHLIHILETYASTNSAADSIYEFTDRATEYCLNLARDTPAHIIEETIDQHPGISEVSVSVLELSKYGFQIEQIPSIRAALYYHGFYHGNKAGGYHAGTSALARAIYPNTLNKRIGRARIHILSFFPGEPAYRRELESVAVRSSTPERVTVGRYTKFRAALFSLGMLRGLGIAAPPQSALSSIEYYHVETRQIQRFRLVPFDVIMNQLTKAIEFHFLHGRNILNSYCRLARYCIKENVSLDQLTNQQVINIIDPALLEMGVRQLGLISLNERFYGSLIPQKGEKKDFYDRLRSNHGILELLAVYIGCVEFIVGLLMARRLTELTELPLLGCLDKTLEWLIFDVAKSSKGLWGARDKQARPIDKLGSRMIRELQRFQRYLKKIGYIEEYGQLFSTPDLRGKMKLSAVSTFTYLRNLDLAFDYFESPTNSIGQRYYIRQHQLRRFFALLFFYFFDGQRINGIRWHLGQADAAHVWHYITEVVDGVSLRGAKSQYILERMLKDKDKAYRNLADYIEQTYGINDVMLADDDEVDIYIQEQMALGNITIEPEFFKDEQGMQMKIIVIIKKTGEVNYARKEE